MGMHWGIKASVAPMATENTTAVERSWERGIISLNRWNLGIGWVALRRYLQVNIKLCSTDGDQIENEADRLQFLGMSFDSSSFSVLWRSQLNLSSSKHWRHVCACFNNASGLWHFAEWNQRFSHGIRWFRTAISIRLVIFSLLALPRYNWYKVQVGQLSLAWYR